MISGKTKILGGIIALLTAVAALLTAVGGLEGITSFVDWIGSKQIENKRLPVEAVLSLRKNMDYLEARRILLSAGWKPVPKDSFDSELTVVGSDPSARFGIELPELHHCLPTGLGICGGALELKDGRQLIVTVSGVGNPDLLGWEPSFYIAPSQTKLNAVNHLEPGLKYRGIEEFLFAEGWQSPIVNPMHRASELPASALDFVKEFANFQDCQVENEEIKSCRFVFFSEGEKNLIITTDIKKDGSKYEPIIQSWSLS